ncbi:MAG: pentapeptide repeat-containing protein [Chloroflexi bacterium]|nr:pentapeptide repeat-containing protein [Chloroflexota bacterium]
MQARLGGCDLGGCDLGGCDLGGCDAASRMPHWYCRCALVSGA